MNLLSPEDEFIQSTDSIYQECSAGIATLDRIIVSVNSSLASETRAYLVPLVYAYWERFFKLTFSEFLRCVTLLNVNPCQINHNLAKFIIKQKISQTFDDLGISRLQEIIGKGDATTAKSHYSDMMTWFDSPLSLTCPLDMVETESNVKFRVLENICTNFGISIEEIKTLLGNAGRVLYVQLNELVDHRNKIAHGENFQPIAGDKWDSLKGFVLDLMTAIQMHMYQLLKERTKILR